MHLHKYEIKNRDLFIRKAPIRSVVFFFISAASGIQPRMPLSIRIVLSVSFKTNSKPTRPRMLLTRSSDQHLGAIYDDNRGYSYHHEALFKIR